MLRVIPLRVVEPAEPTDLIPVREAAALIGVTRATVYNWLKGGRLRAWRRRGDARKFVRERDARFLGGFVPDVRGSDDVGQSQAG